MEEYVQEVGRGGRDGETFEALMIYKSYHLAVCEADMKAYVKNPNNECRRKLIMQSFREKLSSQGNSLECFDVCAGVLAGKEDSGATLPDFLVSFDSANNIAT